jgi:hypothetical protein
MVNYQNGKIYKLWSPSNEELIYIGSTTQNLSMRKAGHIASFKRWQNQKSPFMTSFSVLECDDHRIDLIETFPCNSNEELLAREGYWIQNLACLNKYVPSGLSRKEYQTRYLQENKKHKQSYDKEYNLIHKDSISKRGKQYYDKNKDFFSQKNREYREKSKRTKCSCSCGLNFLKSDLRLHIKSKMHQNFVNNSKNAVLVFIDEI